MADVQYQTFSYRFQNGGLQARYIYDKPPAGTYRNLRNIESRQENSLSTRKGWLALTTTGAANTPLANTPHSIGKINTLSAMYRYVGAGGTLMRSPVPTSFSQIASGLSGNRLSMAPYRPAANANPWMFIADDAVLLKDNGTNNAAENWGMAAPLRPCATAIGDPAKLIIDTCDETDTSTFVFSNFTSPAIAVRVQGSLQATGTTLGLTTFNELQPTVVVGGLVRSGNVTTATTTAPHGWITGMRIAITNPNDPSFNATSTPITVTGATTFTYANIGPNSTGGDASTILSATPSFYPGMFLVIDSGANQETVFVITVIPNVGFTANQTLTHTSAMPYTASCLQGNVAATTKATITKYENFNFIGTSQQFGTPYNINSIFRSGGVTKIHLVVSGGTPGNPYKYPPWKIGDQLVVAGCSDTSFNGGPFTITSTLAEGADYYVTYNQPGPDDSGVSGSGTVTRVNSLQLNAEDEDYFSLFFQASNPFAISEIRLMFDVGDGTFTKDYYYKSITPSTSQPAVSGSLTSGSVLTRQVFDRASGLTDNRLLGVKSSDLLPADLQSLRWLRPAVLNTGTSAWSSVQAQRGEFVQVGAAGTVTNGWDKVVAWRIQITTQPNTAVTLSIDDLVFIAGSGLDAFGNDPYNYRITLYNENTGLESNPSVTQIASQYISPRRQPVLISQNQSLSFSKNPTLASNSGAGTAWTNPTQIIPAPGNVYADVLLAANQSSQALVTEGYGFSLAVEDPSTIVVNLSYYWTGTPGLVLPKLQVQLTVGGVLIGVPISVFLGGISPGSSSNPLKVSLSFPAASQGITATDVNDPTFGFQVIASGGSSGIHVFVGDGFITAQQGAQIDAQATHWRIYRQGGTLTQAWYQVATVPIESQQYLDIQSDSDIEVNDQLVIDNDPPVTSVMPVPLRATVETSTQPSVPGLAQLTLDALYTNVFPGQFVSLGVGKNYEQAYVEQVGTLSGVTIVKLWLQFTHYAGETLTASNRPQVPMNLMAIAFDKAWLAGDPNNPHVLYYSKTFNPEVFPQQNFIEVGTPDAPIMALIEHRGLLYVFTTKTVYQIMGAGSSVPIAIPTGVKHGLTGSFAWAVAESVIYYESYDGVYVFSGGASNYLTEPVEWIFTSQNLGPVLAEGLGQKANTIMAYANHELFASYVDTNGNRRRLIYHDVYRRWRNDDSTQADVNAMNFEVDTGLLIIGGTDKMVYQDRVNDYDWGTFSGGVFTPTPIPFTLQTSQMDQDVPKAFKVYNELTLDMDTNGQTVNVSLVFDNGNTVVPLGAVGSLTPGRRQYQININSGDGQKSQNVGLLITGSTSVVINFFEVHIRAIVEAEFRQSFDSYWSKYGSDEWKLVKQGWFEYSAPDPAGITFLVFGEGNMSAPIFQFTLPQSVNRKTERIRFPATKGTMYRWVATSPSDFQLYNESQIEMKNLGAQKGYTRQKLAA